MVCGPTVCAWSSHSVLPQGPVQHGELPELHLPELVGALRQVYSLLDDFLDFLDGLTDFDGLISLDICVKRFILPWHRLTHHLPLLDGALASDDDFAAADLLHSF